MAARRGGAGSLSAFRSVWRRLSAGVVDSALSSASTMLVGLFASAYLSAGTLGIYSLFFSGFVLAAGFSQSLIFTPAEVTVLAWPAADRLRGLRRSIGLSTVPTLGGAAAVGLATAAIAELGLGRDPWPLFVPAVATFVLSPVQDHVRRMFHIAERSELAAATSAVQLATAAATIGGLHFAGVPAVWVPFTGLGAANLVSLLAALAMAARVRPTGAPIPVMHGRELRTRGWYLAGSGATGYAAGWLATILLSALGGAALAGRVEAARVLASPVQVFGAGMLAVLNPMIIRAAQRHDRRAADRIVLPFVSALVLTSLVLGLVAQIHWPGNPLPGAFPTAFEDAGLVATMAIGIAAAQAVQCWNSELLGVGGRDMAILTSGVAGSVARLVFTALVVILGVYAAPLSLVLGSVAVVVVARLALRDAYQPVSGEADLHPVPSPAR